MKGKLSILMALLISLGACKKNESLTILSGRLPDLKNETISLIPVNDYFPGLESQGKYPVVKTDSLGIFRFSFNQKNPDFYQIIRSNYHQLHRDIFLEPGDSIYIEQSSWNEDPKFVFTGKGSGKLKHLETDYNLFPKNKSFYDKIESNSFATEFDFKKYIDSIHFERVTALTSAASIPALVKTYHFNTLHAERAGFLLEHLERRNYYMKEEFDYFFPDETYYRFLDSIKLDNAFSRNTAAKLLTNQYLTDKARHSFKNRNEEEWVNENLSWKFNFISSQPTSAWTDLLALSTISEYSFGIVTDDFFDNLEAFERSMSSLFSSKKQDSLFEYNVKAYKNLAPGSLAPDFELPDSNGLLRRLSDFKGKIVYIDFWGTWCYPCIQEIPDAILLQEKYKDQPVAFIYVALEYDHKDINRWKEFIAGENQRLGKFLNNKPFPGVHLVAEKQFRNESISAYKLSFAPTHVLIDQDGKIVKARAKRSKDIYKEIDQLLRTIKENKNAT